MGGALEMVSLIREGLHEQSFFFLPPKKLKERLSADTGTSSPAGCRARWTARNTAEKGINGAGRTMWRYLLCGRAESRRKGINKQEEKCMDIYNVDGRRTPPPPSFFSPPPCRFRAVFAPQNRCK